MRALFIGWHVTPGPVVVCFMRGEPTSDKLHLAQQKGHHSLQYQGRVLWLCEAQTHFATWKGSLHFSQYA